MIVEELLATLGVELDVGSIAEAESALGGLKTAAGLLIGALGFHELHEMVKGVAEVGDAASKSSQKIGISAEAIQELGYAAKLSDISQESLEGSLRKLSRTLDEVYQKGTGPAADALKRLGISVKDLKGETVDANLEVIADAFAKMPDGMEKSALAMKLFGRSGTEMIPFLNGGAAGIKELREEAQKLGIVIDDETAKKFEEFNDDQTRLSEAWRGLKVQIVSDLLPSLQGMVTGLLEWVKANRETIAQNLETVIRGIASALGVVSDAVQGVVLIFRGLMDIFGFLSEHGDVIIGLLTAAVVIFHGEIIGLIGSFFKFFTTLSPLNTFLLILTAVALAAKYLHDNWDEVVRVVTEAWDSIVEGAKEFWAYLQHLNDEIVDAFKELGNDIAEPFIEAYDKIKDIAAGVKDYFNEIFGGSLGDVLLNPQQALAQQQHASADSVPGVGGAGVQTNVGDTNITINALGQVDEGKLANMAAVAAAEAQRQMLTDAHDAMKGGRRS